jgi:4-diphosphocytidyl-2-C-methyl-D-erythritol kinase
MDNRKTITRNACAKINLGLDVVGVREDGYHLLRMIMQQIDVFDTLTFTVTDAQGTGEIRLIDESGLSPDGQDNLICRAIRMMEEKYHLRADIEVRLIKRIPVAAGLAGGSTDAAAAFTAVRDLLLPQVTDSELMELGVRLGADIPYCIAGGIKLSEGIGEILTALPPMPECAIVLIKPEASASTAHVYKAVDSLGGYHHPDIDGQIEALRAGDLRGLAERCENVLELVTGENLPVIGRIEDFLIKQGALGACMSGSGPSVFGIFETREQAENARQAFLRTESASGCRSFVCTPVSDSGM